MKKLKFYIAHTFEERHFVRDEFIPSLQKMGIETVNPFYNADASYKEERPEVKIADDLGMIGRFWKAIKKRHENIVEVDLDLIFDCDGIIAFMAETTAGTTCEIFFKGGVFRWIAKRKLIPMRYLEPFLNKYVFLVTTNSRLTKHPWMNYSCTKIFKTPRSLRRYIKKNLIGKQ